MAVPSHGPGGDRPRPPSRGASQILPMSACGWRTASSPTRWMSCWIWSTKPSPTSTNWQRQRMGCQKRIWKSWAPWSRWQSQSPRHRSKTLRKALTSLTLPLARTTPPEYGKYMIQQSGHFEYDENLDAFYDYEKYGTERMNAEDGCSPTGVTSPIRAIPAWRK